MEVLGQNYQECPLKHGIVIYSLGTAQLSYKKKINKKQTKTQKIPPPPQKTLFLGKFIIFYIAAFLDVLGHRRPCVSADRVHTYLG